MSFNYSSSAETVLKLLTNFGQDVTRREYTQGTYDPSTGLVTPVITDSTRKGVALPFGAGQTLERGSLIQNGDIRLLLEATGSLNLQDHFIVDGFEYVILSFAPLSPAGTNVLFDCHLRK